MPLQNGSKSVQNLLKTCGFFPFRYLCQVVFLRKGHPRAIKKLCKTFGFPFGAVFDTAFPGVFYVLLPDFPQASLLFRDIIGLWNERYGTFDIKPLKKGPDFAPRMPSEITALVYQWGSKKSFNLERFNAKETPVQLRKETQNAGSPDWKSGRSLSF